MIKLRTPFGDKDCRFLYDLRNAGHVKKYSCNKDKFPYSLHKKWFKLLNSSNDNLALIAELGGKRIGYSRVKLDKDFYLISVALTKEKIHKGLGPELIIQSCKRFAEYVTKDIVAQIEENNIASLIAFLKSGYRFWRRDKTCVFLRQKYEKHKNLPINYDHI